MLAAWIPGPALVLAIVVGVNLTTKTALQVALRQWLPRLALFGIVCLVASGSWMLVVDAWPKSDRPFIGGSTNNTVEDLALGYNGLGRVEGENGGGGFGGGARPGGNFPIPQQNRNFPGLGGIQNGGTANTNNGGNNANRGNFGGPAGGPNGAGGIIAGEPSIFRMFDSANGAQIAWFLPFALIGGVIALWRWRAEPVKRAAVVAFLGWVVLFGGVFSYTQGIYHSYYTSAMAPGIGAIAGISTVAVTDLIRKHWAWIIGLAAMIGSTLYAQLLVSGRYTDYLDWVRPYGMVVVVIGLAVLALSLLASRRIPLVAGPVLAVAGLLLIPGVWSGYEAAQASLNTTLPQAGPRAGAAGRSFGSQAFDSGTAGLAEWLKADRDTSTTWDLAVTSAQNASTWIAEYDLSVMALGGFSGRDQTITAAQFADLVREGKVRYVLTTGGVGGIGGGGFPTFRTPTNGTVPGLQNGGTTQVPNGANRGNRTVPNLGTTPPNGGFNGLIIPGLQPGASNAATGANAVMSAVTSTCTPVTDTSLPAQYRNGLYDCAGKRDALAAR
jgi:4-amino-4-deoxy-L-arabinose transferase-like glycosyltransferase